MLPIENETDNYVYNWTRLKELQIMIHHNIRRVREEGINAKRIGRSIYTRVEEEVSDKIQHEIDESDEE